MKSRVTQGEGRGRPGATLPERRQGAPVERERPCGQSGGARGAGRRAPRGVVAGVAPVAVGVLVTLVALGGLGLAERAVADTPAAGSPADGSTGGAVRHGSQTEVDPGGVAPGQRAIGQELNVYGWGKPDPNAGKSARDDGDWLEVKGGGGEVWSKGHVFDADHRSGASTLRGGVTSRATVTIHVTVPPDCAGTGTCSDAITMPWDYCVSGDGIHLLRCTGTGVDITGTPHTYTLEPSDLSSGHQVIGKADEGASQRGSVKGSVALPSLLKVEAHDEGTVTSSSTVEFLVTSSSAKAKSGVVVVAKVTDTKAVQGGSCGWEYSSSVLDLLSAQALVARADTSLGRFDVLHAIETSWSIVSNVEPEKSHGPHDLGPLPRSRLAPETTPRIVLPGDGSATDTASSDDGATAKLVDPRGLASETGATPGLLFLETDRRRGPALTWALTADPAGRLDLPATLVVRADDPTGTAAFSALEAGPFTLCATLLDAQGLPTSTALRVGGESRALASLPTPRTTARVDGWHPDAASGRWLALAGGTGGGLRLERSGFADVDDASTTFELEVLDPAGVLRALPPTASIAAGETWVRLPLEPCDVVGDAEVVVRCGGVVERLALRTVRQAVGCPLVGATVPVGGRAVLPLTLAVPEDASRAATVTAVDPTVAAVPADASVVDFGAGSTRTWAAFEAQSPGAAVVRVSTPGVPDLDVPVRVVPTEVGLTRAAVTLSPLGDAAAGVLRLRLPEGATWQGAVGDSERAVEVVGGLGTRTLVLRVAPRPDRDQPTVVSVTVRDAPTEPFDVEIDDRVHGDRSIYRVLVR